MNQITITSKYTIPGDKIAFGDPMNTYKLLSLWHSLTEDFGSLVNISDYKRIIAIPVSN